jgi:hypothetical protein
MTHFVSIPVYGTIQNIQVGVKFILFGECIMNYDLRAQVIVLMMERCMDALAW